MKWAAVLLIVLALATWLLADQRSQSATREREFAQAVSIWQSRYAEAASKIETRVDTVRVYATKYRTLRDSVVLTDTVTVERTLAAADTALVACDSLAESATAFRQTADSTLHVSRAATDWYKEEARYQARQAKTWKIVSLVLGGVIVWKARW